MDRGTFDSSILMIEWRYSCRSSLKVPMILSICSFCWSHGCRITLLRVLSVFSFCRVTLLRCHRITESLCCTFSVPAESLCQSAFRMFKSSSCISATVTPESLLSSSFSVLSSIYSGPSSIDRDFSDFIVFLSPFYLHLFTAIMSICSFCNVQVFIFG